MPVHKWLYFPRPTFPPENNPLDINPPANQLWKRSILTLRLFTGLLLTAILAFYPGTVFAARHALLVGVGNYAHPAVPDLEGPAFDLESLSQILNHNWQIPWSNMVVLQDEKASQKNILAALRDLKQITKPGDFIFFYFSGHGTSIHARGFESLSPHTGALIPQDFQPGQPVEMISGLIIGDRDIRPFLKELDKDRQILAIFDACYSGNTVRSIGPVGRPRYFAPRNLSDLTDGEPIPFGSQTRKESPYPYRNTVYISAASQREMARDIDSHSISSGQVRTFDGKPHGAMTDGLLRGLSGEADTNGDRLVTQGELYRFIRENVTARFDHTPQLLYDHNNPLVLDEPVLGVRQAPAHQEQSPLESSFKVSVKTNLPGLEARLEALPGVDIVNTGYDILITEAKDQIILSLANGHELVTLSADDPAEIVELISRRARLRELIEFTYPKQTFNVSVDLIGRGGVLIEGETVGFSIRSEAKSHILLINIDPHGFISVLYPCGPLELAPIPARSELRLAEISQVSAPAFGTEYIKVFAFTQKKPELEKLVSGQFWPDDPLFLDLMNLVKNSGPSSQMTTTVKTSPAVD